jgi:hypothetical protein
MHWLEGMWETHKLDLHYPNTEREENRKEEILRMLEGLGELSRGVVETPHPPPWGPPR